MVSQNKFKFRLQERELADMSHMCQFVRASPAVTPARAPILRQLSTDLNTSWGSELNKSSLDHRLLESVYYYYKDG